MPHQASTGEPQLKSRADWDGWFTALHAISNRSIWPFINPLIVSKPVLLSRPVKPRLADYSDTARRTSDLDDVQRNCFLLDLSVYKADYDEWVEQERSLQRVKDFVVATVAQTHWAPYHVMDNVPTLLLMISHLFKSSEDDVRTRLRITWAGLEHIGAQGAYAWINHWRKTYMEMRHLEMSEAFTPTPQEYFAKCAHRVSPNFMDYYRTRMTMRGESTLYHTREFGSMLDDYYDYNRMIELKPPPSPGTQHCSRYQVDPAEMFQTIVWGSPVTATPLNPNSQPFVPSGPPKFGPSSSKAPNQSDSTVEATTSEPKTNPMPKPSKPESAGSETTTKSSSETGSSNTSSGQANPTKDVGTESNLTVLQSAQSKKGKKERRIDIDMELDRAGSSEAGSHKNKPVSSKPSNKSSPVPEEPQAPSQPAAFVPDLGGGDDFSFNPTGPVNPHPVDDSSFRADSSNWDPSEGTPQITFEQAPIADPYAECWDGCNGASGGDGFVVDNGEDDYNPWGMSQQTTPLATASGSRSTSSEPSVKKERREARARGEWEPTPPPSQPRAFDASRFDRIPLSAASNGVGNTLSPRQPQLPSKQCDIEECVCGTRHRFQECFYLNEFLPIPPTQNFQLDPVKLAKIRSELEQNRRLMKDVQFALRRWRERRAEAKRPIGKSNLLPVAILPAKEAAARIRRAAAATPRTIRQAELEDGDSGDESQPRFVPMSEQNPNEGWIKA